jgi:CDP-glycerol glycerophosphotransferase
MLFYVYDIENYRDKLRGFYFDFEKSAPGLLVKTSDAVIDSIKTMKYENTNDINHFHERFCALEDGQASRRVVEKVFLGRSV